VKKDKGHSLEKDLRRLEEIVEKLESGETSLEKSIELYVEGRAVGASCHKRLAELEEQIRLVVERSDGSIESEEFEIDGE